MPLPSREQNTYNPAMTILDVAVPCPLRRSFDYLAPENGEISAGMRVLVHFGNRRLVGVVLGRKARSDVPAHKLKAAVALDRQPTLNKELLALAKWAANYYHHPIGEVAQQMLPVRLRKEKAAQDKSLSYFVLTEAGLDANGEELARAPKQAALLDWLQHQQGATRDALKKNGYDYGVIKALRDKGLITSVQEPPSAYTSASALALNPEQRIAVDALTAKLGHFQPALLEGVTGSGKTEVYLQLIARCIEAKQQSLVLIPEIGLTPQTLKRFEQRFPGQISVLHSGLADGERLSDWQRAVSGAALVVIGTRSAVFTPFKDLGLIIIDEEHDASYKQQDGFRYSARDIAVKRAADNHCPVVLGSATPSLESLHNALNGKYLKLELRNRAGGATPPTVRLVDIRDSTLDSGLSEPCLSAIADILSKGEQALVFLNRRGFSPALQCHGCGWLAQCDHCDVSLTVHIGRRELRCHHCDAKKPLLPHCPQCHNHELEFKGPGTERLEHCLKRHFPDTAVMRIDRDTTSGKTAMPRMVKQINSGEPCVLVGTQMLAKGHHFPNVTLVIMVDIDGGLFSADFRGGERSGQLLTQVAGRAGRAEKPGTVLIQTHAPDHPILNALISQGYPAFANSVLQERSTLGLPPYSHVAVIRADATTLEATDDFLRQVREATGMPGNHAQLLGPLPAPITRKANRYRSSLIFIAGSRKQLHGLLERGRRYAETLKTGKNLRWSIDVDPLDWF
ncbi:MAG: primosomal protein N' (replication factor Y) [Bermanella sp.]|jgi:primosomal protein N' (replication factor Y)